MGFNPTAARLNISSLRFVPLFIFSKSGSKSECRVSQGGLQADVTTISINILSVLIILGVGFKLGCMFGLGFIGTKILFVPQM